jgi:hypothetical protein
MRGQGDLTLSLNCVLLESNLDEARRLRTWARSHDYPISFVVGESRDRFFTEGLEDSFVSRTDRGVVVSFLRELAEDPGEGAASALRYRELADVLAGAAERSLSCYYAMGGVLLGHDGTLYYCSHSRALGDCLSRSPADIYYASENVSYRRRELLDRECRCCPPYTRTRWESEKDLLRTAAHSLRRRVVGWRRRGSEP